MDAARKTSLALYDNACRALAEARTVAEVKDIHDQAAAMREYARRANNHQLEADAIELRMKAQRCLGEMIEAQKQSVGLNRGTAGAGRPSLGGLLENPPKDIRPTLASQGISKNLAHQARTFAALNDEQFEGRLREARASACRVVRRVVNAVVIDQERERYRERTYAGGTVADLEALVTSGKRFPVILADPPWRFKNYSGECAVANHYDTMPLADIKALPVRELAAKNAMLFLWATWPTLLDALAVIEAWGFTYKTAAFLWVKTLVDGSLYTGRGYHTRANSEPVLLAKRGSLLRLSMAVRQIVPDGEIVTAEVGAHSVKPDEVSARIERLYGGPYLELFARRERPGWSCWGNEIPPPALSAVAAE
jgi:N6-adenosine-specific RNA methylase IME4